MSELNLSLYDLDQQLTELWAMREQVEEQILTAQAEGDLPETIARLNEEACVLDEAMVLYFEALPRKVDSTADAWQILDRLCAEPKERKVDGNVVTIRCELDREIDRLRARRDAMRKRLESLKTRVQFVMEGMAWPEGKPRKLEGARHTIYLKANGGRPGVDVYDETLLPDELSTVSVTMRADYVDTFGLYPCDEVKIGPRTPSLSLIAEALGKPCPKCAGAKVVCSFCHGFDDYCGDVARCDYCNGTRRASEGHAEDCPECGGRGKQSVPGARMKPQSSHVEVK